MRSMRILHLPTTVSSDSSTSKLSVQPVEQSGRAEVSRESHGLLESLKGQVYGTSPPNSKPSKPKASEIGSPAGTSMATSCFHKFRGTVMSEGAELVVLTLEVSAFRDFRLPG